MCPLKAKLHEPPILASPLEGHLLDGEPIDWDTLHTYFLKLELCNLGGRHSPSDRRQTSSRVEPAVNHDLIALSVDDGDVTGKEHAVGGKGEEDKTSDLMEFASAVSVRTRGAGGEKEKSGSPLNLLNSQASLI